MEFVNIIRIYWGFLGDGGDSGELFKYLYTETLKKSPIINRFIHRCGETLFNLCS